MPYQSTQFNKYYSDYLNRINATMHLNHKPGEILQVDWAGDTAAIVDQETGEIIPAYVFVATLPCSAYSYVEAFLSMDQRRFAVMAVTKKRAMSVASLSPPTPYTALMSLLSVALSSATAKSNSMILPDACRVNIQPARKAC